MRITSIFLLITLAIATRASEEPREIAISCSLDEDQHGTEEFFTYITCCLPEDVTPTEALTVTSNTLDMSTLRNDNKSIKVTFEGSEHYPTRLPARLASQIFGATSLYYRHSPLENISRADFHDLGHRLSLLDLAHNRIESIPHDAFHDLHGLAYLSIEFNHVRHLAEDTFAHAPHLTTLVVRNNLLNELHPGLFKHAPHFGVLYAEHNRITELPTEIFEANPHMEIVALRQNMIVSVGVDFRALKNVTLVDLTGNADGCDFLYFNTHPHGVSGFTEVELKKWERDLDIFQKNVEENCQSE